MSPFKSSLIELIDNLFFAEKNVSADKAYIRMKRMTIDQPNEEFGSGKATYFELRNSSSKMN